MPGFRRILVCWGGAASNAGLLLYARALTALTPPPEFVFLHVMREAFGSPQQAAEAQVRRLEQLREVAERDAAPEGATRCVVRLGEPLDEILLHAAEICADAILLGHDPRRRGRRSLARRFAAAAPCAVWMVPNGAAARIGRVLAAFDLSASSAAAVRSAAAIAGSAGLSEIHLLHVRQSSSPRSEDDLQRFVATLNLRPLSVRLMVEDGETVGRAIVQTAARLAADLVVVGARGQNPSAAVLLGAETEQTLRESSVPVFVVRPDSGQLPLLNALLDDRTAAGKT